VIPGDVVEEPLPPAPSPEGEGSYETSSNDMPEHRRRQMIRRRTAHESTTLTVTEHAYEMKRKSVIRRRTPRAAFTLMEVLLVLAILGIIAMMVVPQLMGRQQKSMIDRARLDIKNIESSLEIYTTDHHGRFPEGSGQEVLQQLTQPQTNSQGQQEPAYIKGNARDPWGTPYHYEYPSPRFPNNDRPAIWSYGPNQTNDGGDNDDINNWSELQQQ